jgi:hypothetical protein
MCSVSAETIISDAFSHSENVNWWHYLSLLKLSLPVIVVAEDNATYTRYKNNINFTVVKGLNQSDGEKAFKGSWIFEPNCIHISIYHV